MTQLQKLNSFVAWTDTEVVEEVVKRLGNLSLAFTELADVVAEAHRRGLDLSIVGNPALVDDLRKIESGQIWAGMAEKFMHTRVYPRLKNLPLDDQKMLTDTGKVGVVVRRGDGFDFRMMEVATLTGDQARLVFDRGHIRSQAEQIAVLESEDQIEPEDDLDDATTSIRIDVPVTNRQKRELMKLVEKKGKPLPTLVSEALKRSGLLK